MADTSPPTAGTNRRPRRTWLLVMAGIAAAVALLVGINAANDDDPSSAGGTEATTPTTDDSADGVSGSTDDSDPDDTSTSASPASAEPSTTPAERAPGGTTTSTTRPNDAPPPTTIVVSPPATTIVVAAPTTTIVVAAPPTTITVTAPPDLTPTIPPTAPLVECGVLGADDFGDILIELTVGSPTLTVGLVEATFVLNDSEGSAIVSDFLLIEFMSPDEVAVLTVETFEPVPPGNEVSALTCEIEAVDQADLFENQRLPAPDDTCSVLGVDDVGDLQLTTTVGNPSSEVADLIFTFAVRDAQGVRVISDVGFADGLGAGQVATQEVDTLTAPRPGIDVAALTCEIVGLELF